MRIKNATQKGVEEAFGFWLYDHPISVPEIVEEAIKKAFSRWLDANEEAIIAAIAQRRIDLGNEE